jgi:DNA polymerase-4
MHALQEITPEIEIFSVDEAFLDITHCQKFLGSPEKIARITQEKIWDVSQLPCSIGVSGDKTTAKYAAELKKPNGYEVISPWETKERLRNVAVTELCGIGDGIGAFLAKYGIYTCGDMARLPIGILAKRFGNLGRKIWLMCQGADPTPLQLIVPDPKSMGHGKVIPPNTTDPEVLKTYFLHMSEKLAARLRQHQMQAQHFFVGALNYSLGWIGGKTSLAYQSDDGKQFFAMCKDVLKRYWHREPVSQVQLTALDPMPFGLQLDLFQTEQNRHPRESGNDNDRHSVNQIMDAVNERYGEFALAPARLLARSKMPNVIAPAWKPFGHRQTIY